MKSGYIYAADLWCEDCGESICRRLLAEGKGPEVECACGWKGISKILVDNETRLGRIVVECLKCEEGISIDPRDYDSNDFPKSEIVDSESDSVQFCGASDDCFNAQVVGVLPDGKPWKISEWLENDLTTEGYDSLAEAIIESYCEERKGGQANPVVKLEAEWYGIAWPEAPTECEECETVFVSVIPESATGEEMMSNGLAVVEDTECSDAEGRSSIQWRCNWCDHVHTWMCEP